MQIKGKSGFKNFVLYSYQIFLKCQNLTTKFRRNVLTAENMSQSECEAKPESVPFESSQAIINKVRRY